MNNKEEIVLGYLEPIKNVLDTDDDFPSYVNGLPCFMESEDKFDAIKCDQCNSIMKLLLQIFAPLNHKHAQFREIYIFICLNAQCVIQASRIKVFRMQSPIKPQLMISSCKEYLLSPESQHYQIDTEIISAKENEEEYKIAEEMYSLEQNNDPDQIDLQGQKFEKENKLYNQYLQNVKNSEAEGLEEVEGLEKDQQNQADSVFLIYQYFLTQYPNHVIRYCFDSQSKPLAFSETKQEQNFNIKCPYCNKEKIFEFQVNNSILTYLPELFNLEWGSLYIYSCPQSCQVNKPLIEESVFVHLDEQQHLGLKIDKDTKLIQDTKPQKQKQSKQQIQQQQIEEADQEDDW